MFDNKFNSRKVDPLVEAVKAAQADGDMRRKAVAIVNEEFGVYNRNAVIRENLAAYDARIEEAYKCMKEGKPLADKDYDKDGKVESPKDEVWGSRLRAAKKAGKLEEGPMDAGSMEGSKSVTKSAPKEDPSLPKEYPGAASSAPTAQRLSNAKAAIKEAIMKQTPRNAGAEKVSANKVKGSPMPSEKRHPNKGAVTKAPVPGVSIAEDNVEEGKKWIAKAIKKPGALSKQLGVPEKKNIPAAKLKAASDEPGKLGKRARLAMTLKKIARKKSVSEDINIAKGDTLSGLAKKNNTSVDALAKANNIKDVNKIQAGATLKTPTGDKTPSPTTSWVNPSTKDYSASNKGVDKPTASPSLPTMATASPKTGAGAGVSSLPGTSQSASMANPKPAMDPGSMENAKRKTGSLNEEVQVGDMSYRIV